MSEMYPDHAMIDIETAGTAPGSVILSIGGVKFNPTSPHPVPRPQTPPLHHSFEVHIDPISSQNVGLQCDPATLLWWVGQSQQARESILEGQKKAFTLSQALTHFSLWLRQTPPAKFVWAHGASFDPVLLTAAYRAAGLDVPFSFRDLRDTRTLYDLAALLGQGTIAGLESKEGGFPSWPEPPLQHSALWDAWTQAEYARRCYAALTNLRRGFEATRPPVVPVKPEYDVNLCAASPAAPAPCTDPSPHVHTIAEPVLIHPAGDKLPDVVTQ